MRSSCKSSSNVCPPLFSFFLWRRCCGLWARCSRRPGPSLLLPSLVSMQWPHPLALPFPPPHHHHHRSSNMRRVNAWLSQIITSAFHGSVQSDLCADVEVRRMYFPSVAPIGQRPRLQLQPVVLKGGIITRRAVAPFSGHWMESPGARRAFGPTQTQNSGPCYRVWAAPCLH